jgi:hypothetical protein
MSFTSLHNAKHAKVMSALVPSSLLSLRLKRKRIHPTVSTLTAQRDSDPTLASQLSLKTVLQQGFGFGRNRDNFFERKTSREWLVRACQYSSDGVEGYRYEERAYEVVIDVLRNPAQWTTWGQRSKAIQSLEYFVQHVQPGNNTAAIYHAGLLFPLAHHYDIIITETDLLWKLGKDWSPRLLKEVLQLWDHFECPCDDPDYQLDRVAKLYQSDRDYQMNFEFLNKILDRCIRGVPFQMLYSAATHSLSQAAAYGGATRYWSWSHRIRIPPELNWDNVGQLKTTLIVCQFHRLTAQFQIHQALILYFYEPALIDWLLSDLGVDQPLIVEMDHPRSTTIETLRRYRADAYVAHLNRMLFDMD